MILIAIVVLIIIGLIIAISLPCVAIFYLRTIFSTVHMKLYNPFSLRGLLINGATSLWGISNLTIFVSAIELGWSPNNFKLQLNFSNLQIYLERRISSLHSVNLINGNQQANILYNFKNFLFEEGSSQKDTIYQGNSLKASRSKIVKKVMTSYFLEGILHLFVIFFMKTFEIVLTDCKAFVVSGIPQHKISFKTAQSKKESLMLMQCLSEYTLKCQRINVSQEIDHHNKYKFIFKTKSIWVNSYTHYEKHFILMEDIEMDLIIPFSMSLKESFQQIKTIFMIKDASINLTVSDFEHFFQFIKQMLFRIDRRSEQEEPASEKEVCLFVGKIKLQLNELYQKQFDNFQAKQYLSHLCKANVQLIQFSLSQRNFSISNSTLSITKYSKHSAIQREIKILTLPNLQIIDKYSQALVQIRHDDVTVSCHSEQIAFFGKIFSLVNQRIRFQNYNEEIYKDLMENYSPHGTLISQIERMIIGSNPKLDESFSRQVKSKKLIYAPKRMVFLMKMKKLSHVITIDGFTYNRSRNLNELSHEILVNKLTVQHKNFKEFSISNFELVFSETIMQMQLTMRISQIIMQQNLQTLIDYLDGFTLFKHLLQFQSDQKQRSKKPLKKYISIDAIAIHFENELVNLNQLKIDKMSNRNQLLDSLYFSIERCQLILSKVFDRRVEPRESQGTNHILFWIDSFSLKASNEQRNGKIKPKTTIIINGPSLSLPETNVSKILLAYFKIYANLQSHLQAFLINVTSEKLKSLKYHMKEFFKEPDQLVIIVTNLSLSIKDTKFDQNLIAFSKTIRQYLFRNPRQNQAEVLNILRRNNKIINPLLSLRLQKITLEVTPIQSLQPTQRSINEWIYNFEHTNQEKVRNDSSERCRRLKGQQFLLRIRGIQMNIRDYPAPILTIDQIKIAGERLRVRKILGGKQNYLKGTMVIGDIFVSVGLGQLSGWQQIGKRMSELNVVNKTVQRQFRSEKQHVTIWHRVLQNWKWRLEVNKDSPTKVVILTGSIPYNSQKFQLEINKVFGLSTTNETYLGIQHFKLSHQDFTILSMPRLQVFSSVRMRQDMLDVYFDVRMAQDVCSFRFSSAIIKELQELVQLQKDWLLIYGIYKRDIQRSVIELEEIQKMTYLQIVSLLAQKISSEQNGNSILNYLNHFQFKFSAQEISVAIIDQELQLLVSAKLLDVFTLLQPDHDIYNQIKVRRSKINLESVSISFSKSERQQNNFIRETRYISQAQTQVGHIYQFAKCKNLVINFNWYFTQGNKMGLANQWIHADNITAQVSKRMERYCSRMKNLLIFHSKAKRQSLQPRYQRPINKFRKAVLQIIQINRRRKILKGHIKKYNTVVNLENYELFLKTEDKVMILEGKEKALFMQRIQYGQADEYHSLPCEILTISFPSCRIQLSEGHHQPSRFQIMTAGKLTLEIQMSDEKIDEGKCNFENISIEITDQGKNILEEIIMFIVDLVNTHEFRKRTYNVDMVKYEELINNGRQKLKEKIEWNQSDLKWKEKEIFWWNFVFKDVSVLISTADSKILSMMAQKTEMVLHIFDNQKIDRKILFRSIQLINELQPLDSQYRKIMQLGKQNVGLAIMVNSYEVTAFSDAPWKYIKQLSFWAQTLKLRVTQELLQLLIKYLKNSRNAQEQHIYEQIREYKKRIPDYYKVCSIEPLNMQFWLRSNNVFKRMEGIKLHLDKYEMKDFFYTQSELGRNIGFWLLKQVGLQVFSLLGQKIFGDVESSQNI